MVDTLYKILLHQAVEKEMIFQEEDVVDETGELGWNRLLKTDVKGSRSLIHMVL